MSASLQNGVQLHAPEWQACMYGLVSTLQWYSEVSVLDLHAEDNKYLH